jgi:hypothetical protein
MIRPERRAVPRGNVSGGSKRRLPIRLRIGAQIAILPHFVSSNWRKVSGKCPRRSGRRPGQQSVPVFLLARLAVSLFVPRRRKGGNALRSAPPLSLMTDWLLENGPKQLEALFRAIVYQPCAPILIADNDGNSRDASPGASKLLGLAAGKNYRAPTGRFYAARIQAPVSQLWRNFLEEGAEAGVRPLVAAEGVVHDIAHAFRHVLVLPDKMAAESEIPSWVQDYALYLLDPKDVSPPGIQAPRVSTITQPIR